MPVLKRLCNPNCTVQQYFKIMTTVVRLKHNQNGAHRKKSTQPKRATPRKEAVFITPMKTPYPKKENNTRKLEKEHTKKVTTLLFRFHALHGVLSDSREINFDLDYSFGKIWYFISDPYIDLFWKLFFKRLEHNWHYILLYFISTIRNQ